MPAPWRASRGHPARRPVFFEPGEEHWHGAAPNRDMIHLAIQEADATGSRRDWGEHVTDHEYGTEPATED